MDDASSPRQRRSERLDLAAKLIGDLNRINRSLSTDEQEFVDSNTEFAATNHAIFRLYETRLCAVWIDQQNHGLLALKFTDGQSLLFPLSGDY